MKTLLKILLTAMLIIFPVFLYGQNYYAGKDSLLCNGVNYRIKHYSFTNDILIENKANFLRNNLRHKVGSNPVVYYSEATGMGHFADSDNEKFQQIVSQVFSDEEIRLYKTASGSVYLSYVVDPVGGKVLEVRFDICLPDNDMTMLSIPIGKFWKLEILLKEQLVCHISEELKAEKQSYTLSGDSLFAE
jgi:hypothetical protein